MDLLPNVFFSSTLPPYLIIEEASGLSDIAAASRSADSVHVLVDVSGQIIVDH